MWHNLHARLKRSVPLMIGTGAIILVIDFIILLLNRVLKMDKGTALYFSILIVCVMGYWVFRHQRMNSHTDAASEPPNHSDGNDGIPQTTR